jgi:hypothetical protein
VTIPPSEYRSSYEQDHWANFYQEHSFRTGSSFFEFVNSWPGLPGVVVDIGCGQGRDSMAFARAGRHAHGVDKSEEGIRAATANSQTDDIPGKLTFSLCDISDRDALSKVISAARESNTDDGLTYYMRFFLHSIPEDTQHTLLATITEHAVPQDLLAAEFRTDKDIENPKLFGDSHYRRFQSASVFSRTLREQYGWVIDYEIEAQGLSPYKEEDPVLYRVIASQPTGGSPKL